MPRLGKPAHDHPGAAATVAGTSKSQRRNPMLLELPATSLRPHPWQQLHLKQQN